MWNFYTNKRSQVYKENNEMKTEVKYVIHRIKSVLKSQWNEQLARRIIDWPQVPYKQKKSKT